MLLKLDYAKPGNRVRGLLGQRRGEASRPVSPFSFIQLPQFPSASNDSEIVVILSKLIYVSM